jgi:hypothetical protein
MNQAIKGWKVDVDGSVNNRRNNGSGGWIREL